MKKIKLVAVSYINTYPFIYGMEKSGILNNSFEISVEIPSVCASKLLNNQVDIGLIPIAAIPEMPFKKIVTPYCLSAISEVRSVKLLSNSPINKIQNIYLDYHSRTSIILVKILAKNYWKIDVNWINTKEDIETIKMNKNDSVVVIGDKVFNMEEKYKYSFDLAAEWNIFTKLPFVFACWVANKNIDNKFIEQLNNALDFGVNHINESIDAYYKKDYSVNIENYLKENISYNLDENKIKSMKLFFSYMEELEN